MDAISYSYADKQAKRIKKIINDPDSTSGIVTVPKVIASGENITIPSGRVAVLPNVQIDGTLNVHGDVFIPSGATLSSVVEKVTSTDNAIVRFDGTTGKVQNSGVIIDDNNNITTTGLTSAYSLIKGNGFTGEFSTDTSGIYTDVGNTNYRIYTGGSERIRIDSAGNVGIGTSSPVAKLSINSTTGNEAIRIGNSTGGWGDVKGSTYIGLTHWSVSDSSFSSALIGVIEDGTSSYNASMIFSTRGSGTDSLATERMRIDANGNLTVGVSGSNCHNFRKNVTLNAGNPIFEIAESGSGNGWSAFLAYGVGAFGANSANSAVRIGKDAITSRSINAGGTINASGADYAEYEYSNDITLVKGQIVGFKADGTLTDKYSEAIRFAIKSTNPSIVGGDTWGIEEIVGKRPDKPVKSEEMTDEEFAKLEEQYEKDLVDFEARLEAERQKVDRIAYAGKVPVNVYGAVAGQYVIAIEKEDGTIDGKLVNKADMTFSEYQDAVGRVNKILDDGRAEVAVIVH